MQSASSDSSNNPAIRSSKPPKIFAILPENLSNFSEYTHCDTCSSPGQVPGFCLEPRNGNRLC